MSDAYREIFDPASGDKVAADPARHREYSSAGLQAVPWAFKHWAHLNDDMRGDVELFLHPENWKDQSDLAAYKIYLRDWCAYPADFLNLKD